MEEYIVCPLCGKKVKRLKFHFYRAKQHQGFDYYTWLSEHPEAPTLSEAEAFRFSELNKAMASTPEGRKRMSDAAKVFWSDPVKKAKRVEEIRAQHETEAFKELHREVAREFLLERMSTPEGFKQMTEGIKTRGKRTYYMTNSGKVLPLRSQLEEGIAKKLDSYPDLKWEYESVSIIWYDKTGDKHTYHPDFYLPEYRVIIEGKPQSLWEREDSVVRKEAAEKDFKFYFCGYDTSIIDEIIESVTTIESIGDEKDVTE